MAKPKMGFNEPPFRHKYGNEPVEAIVDGQRIQFKSKLEYRWAQYLDFLKTVGEIKDWAYEFHTFRFLKGEVDGYGIARVKEYTPDFLVRTNDNSFEYYETKGAIQKYDFDKYKRLFDERPYVKLIIVFWAMPRISVNKKAKLERWTHRVIWNAREIIKDKISDMQ